MQLLVHLFLHPFLPLYVDCLDFQLFLQKFSFGYHFAYLFICIYSPPSITLMNLVLLTFESIGDKGSPGVEERKPEVCRGFKGTLCSPNVGPSPPAAAEPV